MRHMKPLIDCHTDIDSLELSPPLPPQADFSLPDQEKKYKREPSPSITERVRAPEAVLKIRIRWIRKILASWIRIQGVKYQPKKLFTPKTQI